MFFFIDKKNQPRVAIAGYSGGAKPRLYSFFIISTYFKKLNKLNSPDYIGIKQ